MNRPDNEALEKLLRSQRSPSFGPGFSDRVMRRLEEEQAGPLIGILPREFLRLAAIAPMIAAALATFNLAGSGTDSAQTPLEAVLGLQPLTADSVYDANAIFTADGAATS